MPILSSRTILLLALKMLSQQVRWYSTYKAIFSSGCSFFQIGCFHNIHTKIEIKTSTGMALACTLTMFYWFSVLKWLNTLYPPPPPPRKQKGHVLGHKQWCKKVCCHSILTKLTQNYMLLQTLRLTAEANVLMLCQDRLWDKSQFKESAVIHFAYPPKKQILRPFLRQSHWLFWQQKNEH